MVVACVALFVALGGSAAAAIVVSSNSQIAPDTIYGANKPSSANDNIVNGSVAAADIKKNTIVSNRVADASLLGADLANDTLTGAQINESTLGMVPNAAALDGNTPGAFYHRQASTIQKTSDCATSAQTWTECAAITVTVPSDHYWYVTVISGVTANPGNANVEPLFCPASSGPSCLSGIADRMTFAPNQYGNWSSSYTALFGSGTYRFNTAMKWPFVLPNNTEAYTETTVIVSDYRSASLTGP